MRISKQARHDAKRLLRSCLVRGVLDDSRVRQAVDEVVAVRPRGYLAMLSHFQRLLKIEVERRTARVDSAAPLSAEMEADVRTRLNRLYGQGLEIRFAQNPALIGGMRVQVGSDVYDGSVQSRLTALAESF